ncbi:hypothetical protein GQ44DRAFT_791626, partial [Phaeosphaeriaceae sp. PMI808]
VTGHSTVHISHLLQSLRHRIYSLINKVLYYSLILALYSQFTSLKLIPMWILLYILLW